MTLWSRMLSFFQRKRRADPFIRLTSDGFVVLDADTQAALRTVHWADVLRIQTYKLDLITTDCICLVFEFKSSESPVQLSEEWPGFQDLFVPLSTAFPSIPQDWYGNVMKPPFEEKRTILFQAEALYGATEL